MTQITQIKSKLKQAKVKSVLATVFVPISSGGGGTWGSITGTLSNQTDLQTALNAKQNTGLSWLLASGGTLTGPNTIVGSSTNIVQWQFPSLATTPVNGAGLWLQNPTEAALGAQQISPSIVWEGNGWQTNTSGSQSVKFKSDVLPVQGAANPSGTWKLQQSINGSAYSDVLSITSAGDGTIAGNLTISGGTLTLSSTRILVFNGGLGTIGMNANAGVYFRANASSTTIAGGYYKFDNVNGSYSATAGTLDIIGLNTSFAPTSGTAVLNSMRLTGTINQTGGANGQITGWAGNYTITAAVNVTGYDWNPTNPSNISGKHYAFRAMAGNWFSNDGVNFVFGTTTGTKHGTATNQKQAFWNATPVVQPTTGITGSAFTANSGTGVNDASTFDGYTIKQVVAALRQIGLLA